MQLPVKLSYRGLEKSDQIDNLVLDYAARLEKFCDQDGFADALRHASSTSLGAHSPGRRLLPRPGRPRKFNHLLTTDEHVLCAVDAGGKVGGAAGVRMRTADQAAMRG